MIDQKARRQLATLLHSLSAGQISNDEFEQAVPDSDDAAIQGIFHHGAWYLYSDTKAYKLIGKDALSPAEQAMVARWIVFLKSDRPYTWPSVGLAQRFLYRISFGLLGQSLQKTWENYAPIDDWPFISAAEHHAQKIQNR